MIPIFKNKVLNKQNTESHFKITNKSDDTTEIIVFDEIGGWYGIDAKNFANTLNQIQTKNILIRLNTPGGSVFDGVAIHNAIKAHSSHITIRIEALAASIGSVIALAADKIEMYETSFFMIHNPWVLAMGEADDLRKQADLLDKIKDTIINVYNKRLDSEYDVVKAMDDETWYTAEEALEVGFIDEIIKEDDSKNMLNKANEFNMSIYKNLPDQLKEKEDIKIDNVSVEPEPILKETEQEDKTEEYKYIISAKIKLAELESEH